MGKLAFRESDAQEVSKLAFECGISSVSINPGEWRLSSGESAHGRTRGWDFHSEGVRLYRRRTPFSSLQLEELHHQRQGAALNYQQRGP
jgi:hypothetical protein